MMFVDKPNKKIQTLLPIGSRQVPIPLLVNGYEFNILEEIQYLYRSSTESLAIQL